MREFQCGFHTFPDARSGFLGFLAPLCQVYALLVFRQCCA